MIVVDASVVLKLVLDEPDSTKAHHLFARSFSESIPVIAPDVLTYELISVALRYGIGFAQILDFRDDLVTQGLALLAPTRPELILAERIATSGHGKSGRPDLMDSIYHAMAIAHDALLVTADHRHLSKANAFGHAVLLQDWEPS